jgi:hypothetical protein
MRRATRAVLALCAALAAVSLTACGDDEPEAAPSSPSASVEATPSESATPTPTPKPRLSRFEGGPQVRALRRWAAAYGKAINAGDTAYPTMRPLMTDTGFQGLVKYLAPDDEGLHYPGPLPFTPTAVQGAAAAATVPACTWVQGWAQNPASKRPARPKQIAPSRFTLERVGGKWKVSGFYIDEGNQCARITVKGVTW